MKVYKTSYNKVYSTLDAAKKGIEQHAAVKGYTVEWQATSFLAGSAHYLKDGEDVFGTTDDYAALIEEMEFVE